MQQELKQLARRHGQRARVYTSRLSALLKMYHANPVKHGWLRNEALNLSKIASYHMRHADTLSRMILAMETQQKGQDQRLFAARGSAFPK